VPRRCLVVAKWALALDFDGTITLDDIGEILLRRFAAPGWERFDSAMLEGILALPSV